VAKIPPGKAGIGQDRTDLLAELLEALFLGKKKKTIPKSQHRKRSACP